MFRYRQARQPTRPFCSFAVCEMCCSCEALFVYQSKICCCFVAGGKKKNSERKLIQFNDDEVHAFLFSLAQWNFPLHIPVSKHFPSVRLLQNGNSKKSIPFIPTSTAIYHAMQQKGEREKRGAFVEIIAKATFFVGGEF